MALARGLAVALVVGVGSAVAVAPVGALDEPPLHAISRSGPPSVAARDRDRGTVMQNLRNGLRLAFSVLRFQQVACAPDRGAQLLQRGED